MLRDQSHSAADVLHSMSGALQVAAQLRRGRPKAASETRFRAMASARDSALPTDERGKEPGLTDPLTGAMALGAGGGASGFYSVPAVKFSLRFLSDVLFLALYAQVLLCMCMSSCTPPGHLGYHLCMCMCMCMRMCMCMCMRSFSCACACPPAHRVPVRAGAPAHHHAARPLRD